MTRTVAVTGDSGRLGRAVVHALVDDGWELVIFDRVPAPSSPTRFEDAGEGSALTTFALSPAEYAPWGGAVPVVVRGSLVGVLAVSGLASAEDHDLAVAALRAELA